MNALVDNSTIDLQKKKKLTKNECLICKQMIDFYYYELLLLLCIKTNAYLLVYSDTNGSLGDVEHDSSSTVVELERHALVN